jgi:hypothetical protein
MITGVSRFGGNLKAKIDQFQYVKDFVKHEIKRRSAIADGGGTKTGVIGFVFSDSVPSHFGKRYGGTILAKFLRNQNIAKVAKLPVFENYNTGYPISVWAASLTRDFVDSCLEEPTKVLHPEWRQF